MRASGIRLFSFAAFLEDTIRSAASRDSRPTVKAHASCCRWERSTHTYYGKGPEMNRFASSGGLVVAAVLGAVVGQSFSQGIPSVGLQQGGVQEEIKVRNIVVVDKDGKALMTLGAQKQGYGMEILGKNGQARISLVTFEDAGLLQVWHKDGPDGPFNASLTSASLTLRGKGADEKHKNWASIGVGGGKSELLLIGDPSAFLKSFDEKKLWSAP